MANDILTGPRIPKDISKLLDDKPVAIIPPLVSIFIPCCGMLEYTELCIPSILKNTRMPFELIFLDIGSLDGTAEYLRGLKTGLQNVRIDIVRTPTDLGIPKACREALDRCRGEFIVLLNNDTIVTKGWINQFTGLLNSNSSMGMVGPMSNYAPLAQAVESVPYRFGPRKSSRPDEPVRGLADPDAIQAFAAELHEKNKGKCLPIDILSGFCVMLKRDVYRKVSQQGALDKWTDLSLFDSDILGKKVRQFGYNLAVCQDVFIHHFGSRTFAHGAPSTTNTGNGQQVS